MRRITILLAALAALMLVPAASAFANGTMTVIVAGEGSGTVDSTTGSFGTGLFEGSPPIECSYDGVEATGVCNDELNREGEEEEEFESTGLRQTAASGSEFVGWVVEVGGFANQGCKTGSHDVYEKYCSPLAFAPAEPAMEVIAVFEPCAEGSEAESCAAEPATQPLTARINQGSGTLVSNPAGIECSGAAITECTEEFEEGEEVTLTASPAAGYRLNTWNCASGAGTVNGRQCTVTMSEAREVRANFVPVYDLTVSKTEGSLPGLVAMNPPGDSCLYNCQTITQAYKTGAEVTLSANSYGHKHLVEFTGGTGAATACDGTTECTVTIGTEDSSVEAVFGFDAKSTLSLEKTGGGTASIRAPSGFKCRSICLTASATYWQSPPEEVTVYWELEPGTSSLEWTSGAGTCTGTKTAVSGSCKVTMDEAHELVATLE